MAQSFIGKPISLISHSDVRYRGILAGIDPAASTIQLSNVFSMGTESRRPPAEFIPPVQEPYQYIIFRASEVKDLAVDEPTPRRSVHDDPAVLGASAQGPPPNIQPYPAPHPHPHPHPPPHPQQAPPQAYAAPVQQQPQPQPSPNQQQQQQQQRPTPGRRTNSVHTAAASLETVERALGDLRVSNASTTTNHHPSAGRGGRRGGRGGAGAGPREIKVPATDFDFERSNAKFDKSALTPRAGSAGTGEKENDKIKEESGAEEGADDKDKEDKEKEKEKEKEAKPGAYNPQKSFFDSLSSAPPPPVSGGGGRGRRGGGGRGGMGRNRREEERERNVATFGEPGGVGLMGPGAYVGGWGGYGRRGGRPRRGGPPVAQQGQTQAARV